MRLFCYADAKYKRNLMRKISKITCRDDMKVDKIQDGTFIVNTKTGAYGVFDKSGNFVKSCLQYRGKHAQFIPKFSKDTEYMDCDAVFIGNACQHFGHFLLEHINRAWGIRQIKSKKIKYVLIDNQDSGKKQYMIDLLLALGCPRNDILILNKSMRFKNIYVPSQTLNIVSGWWAPEFKTVFDLISKNIKSRFRHEKIYVSRAKLPESNRVYGEDCVQRVFEKNGFKVIYPETMSITQQIAMIKNAKILAGCAGTALHLSLFMKDGTRVVQMNRTKSVKDNGEIQYRLCKAKNQGLDIVAASVEEKESSHGGMHAPQIIGFTQHLKEFFNDNDFIYNNNLKLSKSVWDKYNAKLAEFNENNGGYIYMKFKNKFIKYVSCFVPGRVNRGRFRKWLKEKL